MSEKPYKLILGDCLIKHEQIESGSVDLILSDLPYGNMKNNPSTWESSKFTWDTSLQPNHLFQMVNRLLRKNGKMVLFSQEPYTTELVKNASPNIPFSYRMTWEKDTFANSLGCNKAPVSYTEDILVFSKNHAKHDFEGTHPLREYFKQVQYFIGLNKKGIVQRMGQRADHTFRTDSTQFSLCTKETYQELIDVFKINEMPEFIAFELLQKTDTDYREKLIAEMNANFPSTFNLWEGNKYKSNILKYRKDYTGFHPTQKPVALLQDLIKTFSNENNLVVDLTMGSGSTGVACMLENRRFIGIEQESNYFDIAQRRIDEALDSEPLFKAA